MDGLGIGRVVHFTAADGSVYAAIVSRVINQEKGYVNLHVLVDDDANPVQRETSVYFSEVQHSRTWRWPPRD